MRTVVDFGASEAARGLVNDWTARQTLDRIPEILPRGSVDAATRLVLVNAMYFKAPWDSPFERPPRRRVGSTGRTGRRCRPS